MAHEPLVKGIIVATLTPFETGGGVDLGVVREHVGFLVARGVPGLAPVGTTGEALYLSEEEKTAITRTVVEAARGRAKVIAGIWALSPAEVGRLARAAEAAGADGVFFTPPVYYRYSDAAIGQWYRHAVAHTSLPIYAYNIPAYSGNPVSRELLEELVGDGSVAGIKDSTGKAEQLQMELEVCRGRASVYGASDAFALTARRLGADGFISALANIYPEEYRAIWEGDEAAQACMDRVRTAVKGYGGIAALKHLAGRRGFAFGPTRLPFSELSETERGAIDRLMAEIEGGDAA